MHLALIITRNLSNVNHENNIYVQAREQQSPLPSRGQSPTWLSGEGGGWLAAGGIRPSKFASKSMDDADNSHLIPCER